MLIVISKFVSRRGKRILISRTTSQSSVTVKKKILSQEIVLFVDAGAALAERVTIGIIVNSARLVLEVDLNPPHKHYLLRTSPWGERSNT